jgi:hypothetical protein
MALASRARGKNAEAVFRDSTARRRKIDRIFLCGRRFAENKRKFYNK